MLGGAPWCRPEFLGLCSSHLRVWPCILMAESGVGRSQASPATLPHSGTENQLLALPSPTLTLRDGEKLNNHHNYKNPLKW